MTQQDHAPQQTTALRKYDRLECTGLWREQPDSRLREVVVGLRSATLILSDFKTEMALAQWSLPALRRVNPAKLPAIYAPGDDAAETLEIDDPDMIVALDTVRQTLERRRAKPGRLRATLYGGAATALLAIAIFWLPARLVNYTAAMLPLPTRAALGDMALRDLTRLSGSTCETAAGTAALDTMAKRLNPDDPARIKVLRAGVTTATSLPGGLVLIPVKALEQSDGPDAIAGLVLAEKRRAFGRDPTKALLRYAGLWSTLKLLTSGEMDAQSLNGYGETLVQANQPELSDQDLLSAFKTSGVSATPYALAIDPSGTSTKNLIDADPLPNGSNPVILDDAAWLGLQAICQ